MRVVSYNILDGGEGRADPLGEVIEAQRPDLVALVESEDLSVVERMARRLGMDYVQAVGTRHASTLLSRYPIRDSINHGALRPELTTSFLEATVQTPEFGNLPVGVVHLAAGAYEQDERVREREVTAVREVLARHRTAGRAHLLVGDFNATAPRQRIDPARCKESTRAAWEANGGQVPRRVVRQILDLGYLDTLEAADPEAAEVVTTFTTQHPAQRVDYIFAYGIDPERVRAAWVETDRLATYASDHYPIGVEVG